MDKWEEIPGTNREFFRNTITGKVCHKKNLWKERVWEDDWWDVPGYEGIYRITEYLGHPIVFSVKRGTVLDPTRGYYTLYRKGCKETFTEEQLLKL